MEKKQHSFIKQILLSAFVGLVFSVPQLLHAQIIISEIMYDLEGADSGREWIEVFNAGSSGVNLTEWKLFEADTNHKITEVQGGTSLGSGAYAVVADNAATFLSDNPGYSGLLFDSAFSLNNSGEPLGIRNKDGEDSDALSYGSDMGAAGDGNSLHRSSTSGTALAAAAPSPGTGSLSTDSSLDAPVQSEDDTSDEDSDTSFVVGKNQTVPFSVEPQVHAYAGEDREVIVGADIELTGRAFAKDGTPLTDARFLWNFGDGVVAEGEAVMHRWNYPGKYILVLDIGKNKYAASDEVIITAVPAQLSVATKDGGIAVTNSAGKTIDLSYWQLYSNKATFLIPENTKVLPKATVIFGRDALGTMTVVQPVELRYPNGLLAVREGEAPTVTAPVQLQQATKAAVPSRTLSAPTRSVAIKKDAEDEEGAGLEAYLQEVSAAARGDDGQVAAAAASGVSWGWGAALAGLLGISGAGVIMLRRANRRSWSIVEDTDDSQ